MAGAVEIIRPDSREAWLSARQQDVTASVAAAVLGAHPYVTPYQLWADKTGKIPAEDIQSEAMERGIVLEPAVVDLIRRRYPDWQVVYDNDRAYYRDPDLRIGATPDAFLYRPDRVGRGNCQIKTASEAAFKDFWLDPDTQEVIPPTWIAVQAITEAKLTGCDWACVALMVLTWRGTLDLRVVDVPLHQPLWNRLCAAVAEFWQILATRVPDIDWNRDGDTVLQVYRTSEVYRRDLTDEPGLDTLVGRYKALREAQHDASRKAEVLKPQIIYALGNAEAGQTAHWDITARTQDREAYEVRSSTTRALRIKPRKIAHASF